MKKKRFFLNLFIFLILSISFWVFQTPKAQAANKLVTSIKIQNAPKKLVLIKGKKYTMKVKVSPSSETNQKLNYKSSNKKVASVSKKGVIKAKKAGKTTITVQAKDGSKVTTKLKVIVGTRIKKITLTGSSTLSVGKTTRLKATISPSSASYQKITWTSSDKNIATVSSSGLVKGVSNGSVTITASSNDGSNKNVTFQLNIITLSKSVTIENDTGTCFIKKGESITLKTTVKPTTVSNPNVIWSSTDPSIASVDANGKVTGHKVGYVTIKTTTADANHKTDSIKVYVASLSGRNNFIAHRGYSSIAPENSAAAFKLAVSNNFYGAEYDIQLTKDGVFVVNHYNNMFEMFGVNINISDYTYEEVSKYSMTAGSNVDLFPNQKIITLEEYLSIMATSSTIHPVIELKCSLNSTTAKEFLQIISKYNMNDRIIIISYSAYNLKLIHNLYNQLATTPDENIDLTYQPSLALLTDSPTVKSLSCDNLTPVDWCIKYGIELDCDKNSLTADTVNKMHSAGRLVIIYTVNDFYGAFLYEAAFDVDFITSNYKFF